ncbi:hypothetical protein IH980_02250 [Patescibacteria group bacterium]|nr:hypothetical protein [Patescibacteria group bacterium]
MRRHIIPAILEESVEEVQKKIERVRKFGPAPEGVGLISRVQIDVIDGEYADNLTAMPSDLVDIDFGVLNLDFHFMTEEPVDYVLECSELHKTTSDVRVIGQVERMGSQEDFVKEAEHFGCQAGLALDLYTPISSLRKNLYSKLDCILLMSVRAGFSGQHFHHMISEKIRKLKQSGFDGEIVMDGGEDPKHIVLSRAAGASEFAVGSFLWKSKDIRKALEELLEAVS